MDAAFAATSEKSVHSVGFEYADRAGLGMQLGGIDDDQLLAIANGTGEGEAEDKRNARIYSVRWAPYRGCVSNQFVRR